MYDYRRGEIYYVTKFPTFGSEQESGRPAIIVSNDVANEHSSTFEIVYLTTQPKKNLPTHATIHATGVASTALCEQVTTVTGDKIGDYLTTCTDEEMERVDAALRESLNLNTDDTDAEIVPAVNVTPDNASITALQTERDLYKRLYEQLLDKLTK